MNTVITFDLHDAGPDQYAKAHDLLEALGFTRTITSSTGGQMPLPETTALASRSEDPRILLEGIWDRFSSAGLNPKRMFVGRTGDFYARSQA